MPWHCMNFRVHSRSRPSEAQDRMREAKAVRVSGARPMESCRLKPGICLLLQCGQVPQSLWCAGCSRAALTLYSTHSTQAGMCHAELFGTQDKGLF